MIAAAFESPVRKGLAMLRWLLCGAAIVGVALEAHAADLGDSFLRGSSTAISAPSGTRWDGFYVGAQAGLAWPGTDFGNSTRSLVAFMLRNTTIENEQRVSDWTTLGKADTNSASYGGFVGYQQQWDSAVVGVEANYNRTNASMAARDTIARFFGTSDGYTNNVRVTGQSSIHVTDYGTLRLKGGWAAGNFMPYAFVGVALGRADVTRTAQVIATGFDATGSGGLPYSFNQTSTEAKNGDFAYGYAIGLGIDMMVWSCFFVRGEYEYVQFGEFNDLKTHIHTARAAVGIKF
jgi:opacity protein-like surface antigen